VVEVGHALRSEAGISVRQKLSILSIPTYRIENNEDLFNLISEELNVQVVTCDAVDFKKPIEKLDKDGLAIVLETNITEDLKREGLLREIVRTVNQMRKDAGLTIQDRIVLKYSTTDDMLARVWTEFAKDICAQVLAERIENGGETEFEFDGQKVLLGIEKI
jgi:isoleucyl-tRNA synthetase